MSPSIDSCCSCGDPPGESGKWIGCCLCSAWSHVKCASLSGVKTDNLKKINWVCSSCLDKAKFALSLTEKVDGLSSKLNSLQSTISSLMPSPATGPANSCMSLPSATSPPKKSYAVVVQSRSNVPVTEKMVAPALNKLQVNSSRPTGNGGLVLKCSSSTKAEEIANCVRSSMTDVDVRVPPQAPLSPKGWRFV